MIDFLTIMIPELLVTAIIFLLLIIKISGAPANKILLPLIQVLLLLNTGAGFVAKEGSAFGNMYFTTPLIVFQKSLLSLGVYILSLVCADWFRKTEHLAEFFIVLLSSLLGLFFLISSGNMLIFFLAAELATIPLAALANFDLHKKRSSEGAMKLILSSAFSSGILLFGISLLYGVTGSISFGEIPAQLDAVSPLLILAFIFIITAFAFKLSIVPFHLWTADVYEGSPIPVTAYLSVISKGAFAFVLISFLYRIFQALQQSWHPMLVMLSLFTLFIGNLFAIRQQNIKRFLAFSSIAQVGFILVGMSANNNSGISAVVYFILIYIFSNLAAFGVVSVVSQFAGKENVDDYKGFYKTNPFLSWVFTLALFSLAGIPPTAGFFGKLFLLSAGLSTGAYWFITLAALNMIISLFYYLRIVRAMFMDKNDNPVAPIKTYPDVKLGLIICCTGILVAGLIGALYDHIVSLIK